jgi:predicted DNA-binding transcriptional regulator AlpA
LKNAPTNSDSMNYKLFHEYMEIKDQYITTSEFYRSLGIGKTKFYSLLKQLSLPLPGKLLSPSAQLFYREKLGFIPHSDTPKDT